jgi:hypothetical protein
VAHELLQLHALLLVVLNLLTLKPACDLIGKMDLMKRDCKFGRRVIWFRIVSSGGLCH